MIGGPVHRRAVLAGPVLLGGTARAQPLPGGPLLLHTAGAGSAFLPYGEGLARWLGAGGIAIEVRRSAGSLQNLAAVEDDPGSLGTAFLGSAWDAVQGTPAAGGRRHTRVRALFPMYETSFQFAVPDASPVTGFAGLDGLRVGVGPARGPAEVFFRAAADAAGIAAEIVNGDPAALADALVEGRIDALWQGAVVPIPSLLAVLGRTPARVLGLPPALVETVTARLPFLSPTTLPPATYPGQAAPIGSFAAWNVVVAHADLPEATAAALTRRALAAPDPGRDIHPSAAATRATDARHNRVLPFHPGALGVLRELGVALPA